MHCSSYPCFEAFRLGSESLKQNRNIWVECQDSRAYINAILQRLPATQTTKITSMAAEGVVDSFALASRTHYLVKTSWKIIKISCIIFPDFVSKVTYDFVSKYVLILHKNIIPVSKNSQFLHYPLNCFSAVCMQSD